MSKFKFDYVSAGVVLLVVVAALPIVFGGISFDRQEVNLSDNDASSSNAIIVEDSSPTLLRNIVANGSSIYIVWANHTDTASTCSAGVNPCDIVFLRSANNGTTFSTPIILGTSSSNSPNPSIAVGKEGHVFVVWQAGTDIRLSASSNSGSSFDIQSATIIGTAPDIPGSADIASPQILANKTGDNVYVGWVADSGQFEYLPSDDNFNTVGTVLEIGDVEGADQDINTLRFSSNQTHVFVVTQEGVDIVFKSSNSNGTLGSFTNQTIAVMDGLTHHGYPSLVANSTGSEIYVAFREGTDINFTRSDDGTTFSLATGSTDNTSLDNGVLGFNNLSSAAHPFPFPEIAIGEQGRVFVAWQDNRLNDVTRIRTSTDQGVTFGNTTKMSGSADQDTPRIASSDGVVYLVFSDDTGGEQEIVLVTSSNNGATFSGKTFLTANTGGIDRVPQVAASNDKAFVIWQSHDGTIDSTTGELNFTSVTGLPVDYTFNASNYRIGEVVQITVDDFQSSGTINVPIISSTDSSPGITVSLTETGSGTGIFTGTFSFSSSASNDASDILQVSPDDTITATHRTAVGTTEIYPVTFAFNATVYRLHSTPTIQVTDENSNTDSTSREFATVTIQSTEGGDSVSLALKETDVNSGKFGVPSSDTSVFNLILINATNTSTPVGSTLTISGESSKVNVTSTSDPTGLKDLLLTDPDGDGTFTGEITIGAATSFAGRTIEATTCDIVSFIVNEDVDPIISKRLVTPCVDVENPKAAISVDIRIDGAGSTVKNDKLTATLRGVTSVLPVVTIISDGTEQGGGGGGLVRPTVVLNVVAGISSFGGGGGTDGSAPITSLGNIINHKNFDAPDEVVKIIDNYDPEIPLEPIPSDTFEDFDLPLTINDNGYPLGGYSNTIETFSTGTGDPITITPLYYEQTTLQHVSMYLNLRGITSGDLSQSDTQILYNKDKPLDVIDPNGFFESVSVNIIEDEEDIKRFAEFEIVFAKPLEKSDIVLRSWDNKLRSADTIIYDAIEVINSENIVDESLDSEPIEPIQETNTDLQQVPEWIKNNAEWWSQGEVDEITFKNTIQFLVQEEIIDIPTGPNVSVSKDDELDEELELDPEPIPIPEWIKNNAEWWSQGTVTDDDFLNSIEYLVRKGIIQI